MAYSAYITDEFYYETFCGTAIGYDIFDRIAKRASDELDKLTVNAVRMNGLTSYSESTQEAIKLATCVLAGSLAQIDAATDSAGLMASSESVNGYSYSGIDQATISAALKTARQQAWTYLQRGGFDRRVY